MGRQPDTQTSTTMRAVLITFRYVVPGVLIGAGLLLPLLGVAEAAHAFSLFVGAGLASILLNVLYRVGASGESDRYDEQNARDYFSEHGRWPDEEPGATPPA